YYRCHCRGCRGRAGGGTALLGGASSSSQSASSSSASGNQAGENQAGPTTALTSHSNPPATMTISTAASQVETPTARPRKLPTARIPAVMTLAATSSPSTSPRQPMTRHIVIGSLPDAGG